MRDDGEVIPEADRTDDLVDAIGDGAPVCERDEGVAPEGEAQHGDTATMADDRLAVAKHVVAKFAELEGGFDLAFGIGGDGDERSIRAFVPPARAISRAQAAAGAAGRQGLVRLRGRLGRACARLVGQVLARHGGDQGGEVGVRVARHHASQ